MVVEMANRAMFNEVVVAPYEVTVVDHLVQPTSLFQQRFASPS